MTKKCLKSVLERKVKEGKVHTCKVYTTVTALMLYITPRRNKDRSIVEQICNTYLLIDYMHKNIEHSILEATSAILLFGPCLKRQDFCVLVESLYPLVTLYLSNTCCLKPPVSQHLPATANPQIQCLLEPILSSACSHVE